MKERKRRKKRVRLYLLEIFYTDTDTFICRRLIQLFSMLYSTL